MITAPEFNQFKPYLLRATYEWCCDQGFTPYVSVMVDETVQVPGEFVTDGEITLNVGAEATNGLVFGNDTLEFNARFSGIPREVRVPVTHIIAIFARENGEGLVFPAFDITDALEAIAADLPSEALAVPETVQAKKTKPTLRIIK